MLERSIIAFRLSQKVPNSSQSTDGHRDFVMQPHSSMLVLHCWHPEETSYENQKAILNCGIPRVGLDTKKGIYNI